VREVCHTGDEEEAAKSEKSKGHICPPETAVPSTVDANRRGRSVENLQAGRGCGISQLRERQSWR
jgi:hypothetical protein